MRLFEALVIVVAGQITLALAVLGTRGPRWTNLLPLVALAPLVAHLAVEGARWQMAFAYLVVLGLCIGGVIRYLRAASPRRSPPAAPPRAAARVAPVVTGIGGFLLLMVSAAALVFGG
jgi:hypothetical protein